MSWFISQHHIALRLGAGVAAVLVAVGLFVGASFAAEALSPVLLREYRLLPAVSIGMLLGAAAMRRKRLLCEEVDQLR